MHALIFTMMIAVTTFEFIIDKGWMSGLFSYVPEVLSLVALVYFLAIGAQNNFRYIRPAYWLLFGALLVGMVCSAIVNQVEPGPIFAGLRNYLRALPFFLLPATLLIGENPLRRQLVVLLVVCLLQMPLAWEQRMATVARHGVTGDETFGTLMGSGWLSLFLVAATCVLTGLYIRRRINVLLYLALLAWILLPTALNETKITIIVLPLALLTTVYVGSEIGRRLRTALLGIVVTAGFLTVFVPIYDYFIQPRWGYGIVEFFTKEGRLEGYLIRDVEVGDQRPAGKLDGIFAGLSVISRDPAKLVFGLGIGNVSDSALGDEYDGAYYRQFENFPLSTLTYVLLEHGLIGVVLVLLLQWFIFRDCVAVARQDRGLYGALAVGWTGVGVTIVVGLIYTGSLFSVALSYLYWYFSGLLVAFRARAGLPRHDVSPQMTAVVG